MKRNSFKKKSAQDIQQEASVNSEQVSDAIEQEASAGSGEEKSAAEQNTPVNGEQEKRAEHKAAEKPDVRRRKPKLLKIAMILCVFIVLVVGVRYYLKNEENTLEATFYHLQSDKVNTPFRIVQLSDLHLHEFGEKNEELVDWVRRLDPDIITITGDMNIHYNDDTHVVTELCSQLNQITDVYYVMGNHEWVDHISRHTSIKEDIEATGVIMLQNSYKEIELNENKIVIGGLVNEVENYNKFTGPEFMKNFMDTDGFKLLLVHYPEYFLGTLNSYSVDLALCGHTHGGVVRIPSVGGVYATDQGFFPELSEGMNTVDGGSVVVVSRGLGGDTKVPRINNNPEIVVVDVSWY